MPVLTPWTNNHYIKWPLGSVLCTVVMQCLIKICFGHATHNCLLELMKSTVTMKIRLHYKILIVILPHYKIEVNSGLHI